MTRKELAQKICDIVNNSKELKVTDMENRKKCNTDSYKSGLYFLYNSKNKCIYIGKVGNGETASLYMRMKGNGEKSHKKKNKRWYPLVSYGKWHKFNVSDSDLETIERLAIYGMEQPIYNDKDTDQDTVNLIKERLGY